jgi:hypothetical protein
LLNGIHLIVLFPALLAFRYLRPNEHPLQRAIKNILLGLLLLHLFVLVGLAAQLGPSYLGGHHTFLMVFYMLPFAGAGMAGLLGWLRAYAPAPSYAAPVLVALFVAVTLPSSVFRRPESGAVYRTAGLVDQKSFSHSTHCHHELAKLAYHAGAVRFHRCAMRSGLWIRRAQSRPTSLPYGRTIVKPISNRMSMPARWSRGGPLGTLGTRPTALVVYRLRPL